MAAKITYFMASSCEFTDLLCPETFEYLDEDAEDDDDYTENGEC